ncbi:MAG: S8 family serine peptidase [Acidimicrobiales bacterium]
MTLSRTVPTAPMTAHPPLRRRLAAALVATLAVAGGLRTSPVVAAAPVVDPPVRLLVGWQPTTTAAEAAAVIATTGGRSVERLAALATDVVVVAASRGEAALARLRTSPAVAYAEADQQVKAADTQPPDPLWPDQWGPVVTRTTRAWDTTVGDPAVIIAVLDSGVDATHPDLAGALVAGTDLVNGDGDPADDFGHGTSVAAVAAARAGNVGIAGYCWTCSVMPVKVLDAKGFGSLADIAAGMIYAVDRGARIINLSLSAPAPSATLAGAVTYARDRGVLVVAAAGNDGDVIPNYPAATPGALGVVGTDIAGGRYGFSSYGPWAKLAAPGCHTSTRPGGTYGLFCGTSSAAPAVSGIAGLLLSARASATVAEIERALELTTAGTADSAAYGRIDAAGAMAAITTPVAVPAPGSGVPAAPGDVTTTAGNGSITVAWTAPAGDGGSAITGYRVTASPSGLAAEVRPGATSFVLGQLANGVTYTVGVSALNAVGAGPAAPVPGLAVRPVVPRLDRAAGPGRVETAVALSQRAFRGADDVVVARADDYADALTAAPLAGRLGVPLLLTAPDGLSAAVAGEIRRLGAGSALLIGGPAALSPEVEAGLRSAGVDTIDRVAGANRFDTARRLADLVGGTSVYVTEGANADPGRGWPDAVAVSGLAAFQQRPILLTTRDDLPAGTRAALVALGAVSATVVGGTAAVSDAVAAALADPDGDGNRQVTVTRLAGATRWDTSRLVADRALAVGMGANRLWLATGRDWPDALAAGPAAAAKAAVVLLVDGRDLAASPAASTWLSGQRSRFQEVVLVGGTTSITPEVEGGLSSLLR